MAKKNKIEVGSANSSAEQFVKKLKTYRSPAAAKAHSHLASDEEDKIMGVRMGQILRLQRFIAMPPSEIEELLSRSMK
jgi:hypothetical protein